MNRPLRSGVTGLSKSTVARMLALFGVQPHRTKSFKLFTDPLKSVKPKSPDSAEPPASGGRNASRFVVSSGHVDVCAAKTVDPETGKLRQEGCRRHTSIEGLQGCWLRGEQR